MKNYILALDQGTTSTRAILFDRQAKPITKSSMELRVQTPQNGWVEINPLEIWETTLAVLKDVLNDSGVPFDEIAGLGITNQRETTILWDKTTGKPVYNGIVWQSRQSQEICEDWIAAGYADLVKEKTGLYINPYFSASKIKWIFDHVPGVYEKAKRGDVLFGTVDTYLIWKLTNGDSFVTDYTNASRTLLFNIHTLEWDQELLDLFSIPNAMLPTVVSSSEVVGEATRLWEIDEELSIPIAAIAGDQQASLFGQCCFDLGDVKNTYGTGCFMLMNTKDKIVPSSNGLLTTIAWGLNGCVEYALEGSVFVGGSAVQWLRDGMRLFEKSKDCEIYSSRISGSDGVY
ncbi:MAG: glycerol kinase GlpK, partial [Bacilli bacterium]